MAVIETAVLLTSKNESGEKRLIYPITRVDCVDGLDELVDERINTKSVSWNDLTDRPFGDNADGTVKQLDNKYLSIFDHQAASQTEILPETSVEFTGGEGAPTGIAVLNNNEIYHVVWDETEYVLTAQSVVFNGVDGIAVGNTSIIGAGEDSGEPFCLGYAPEHNLNVFVTQSPEDSTHTVRIYQSTEETFTLKDEYRPDIPHFNLAEMGLGDPAEDEASTTFVAADTAEIFAALEKGPVKFTITLGGSVQSHVMTGRYYSSEKFWRTESVYNNDKVLSLAFLRDGIICNYFSAESVLPEVGNSDNGKVLTVVGANWSAQELPAGLPEVTSEDNGKVLSVADGAWSAQDAPTSLPSVTAEDEGKVLSVKDGVWTATEAPAGDGGSASTETDVLAEGEFQFTPNDDTGTLYAEVGELMDANVLLVDGETYQVVWDGTEYTCLASTQSFGTATGIALGNLGLLGIGDTTDEPFIIGATESGAAMCYTSSTEASHTVRIYQKKVETDTVGWNDLFEKTAAKETEILPETSVTFTDGQGNLDPAVELISGSSVQVIWDGTEYTCSATDMTIDGAACVAIGNAAVAGLGDDTGEPFFLAYATSYGMNLFIISTTEESTHTIQIFQTTPERYTLKEEHVGNVDYETKVINKPFGEVAEAGTIIADHNADYDSTDFGFVLTDIDTFESHINAEAILEGATYSVEIAGITYDGVGMTAEALKQIMPSFDGSPIAGIGIAIYQDGTLWGALASVQNILWFIQPLALDSYNSGERYQVKITVVEAIKKIDAKYLPMDAIKAYIDEYIGEVLRGNY